MADIPFPVHRFTFRVVTPLFLGGAQPSEWAELRPPAIKGLLREWYRYIVGPEVAMNKGNEASLFGGMTENSGQCPFLLSVNQVLQGTELWERKNVFRNDISGLNYLGYTFNMVKKGEKPRKAIAHDSRFELKAVFPRRIQPEQHRALLASLWLLTHLGGAGSRSRRGIGSLALEKCELDNEWQSDVLPLAVETTDFSSLCLCLEQGLRIIYDWFGQNQNNSTDGKPQPGYDLRTSRIVVVPNPSVQSVWSQPLHALDYIGEELQKFRRSSGIDGFPTVALLKQHSRLRHAPMRTAFGLPLTYQLPKDDKREKKGERWEFTPYLPPESENDKSGMDFARYPSPLLLHIQAIQGGGYLPVLTLLGGARPGRDISVREKRGRGYLRSDPQNDLPEQFLNSLIAQGAREVNR